MATAGSCNCELTDEVIEAAKAELVESDGEPLESPWHRAAINLLIECIVWLFRGRSDFFVGGNMFVYYSRTQARQRLYRGPDFFIVDGVDGTRDRLYWWVFEEDGRFPDVIIELASPTTLNEDRTTKKDLYEKTFHTPEYYCFDPDTNQLEGWRLVTNRYQVLSANERGWLWSEQLGLWLGTWDGVYLRNEKTWLRFYDAEGHLVPTETETERQHAEEARQHADAERQRAESERRRAAALEAEVARLNALLKVQGTASAGESA